MFRFFTVFFGFLSVEALEVNGKLVSWKLAWGRGFPSRAKGYGRPKYFAADAADDA